MNATLCAEAMTCTIRPGVLSDAAAACEVVRRSIVELCFSDHHGDSDRVAAWLANKTPPNFERWIASEQHIAIVADMDGVLVGFGLLNRVGTIELLYVSPDARSCGVSKGLLAALEEEAKVAGVRELTLESSLSALLFYSRRGYTRTASPCKGVGVTTCYPMSKPIAAVTGGSIDGVPSA